MQALLAQKTLLLSSDASRVFGLGAFCEQCFQTRRIPTLGVRSVKSLSAARRNRTVWVASERSCSLRSRSGRPDPSERFETLWLGVQQGDRG
jgi:hypothetical protein